MASSSPVQPGSRARKRRAASASLGLQLGSSPHPDFPSACPPREPSPGFPVPAWASCQGGESLWESRPNADIPLSASSHPAVWPRARRLVSLSLGPSPTTGNCMAFPGRGQTTARLDRTLWERRAPVGSSWRGLLSWLPGTLRPGAALPSLDLRPVSHPPLCLSSEFPQNVSFIRLCVWFPAGALRRLGQNLAPARASWARIECWGVDGDVWLLRSRLRVPVTVHLA